MILCLRSRAVQSDHFRLVYQNYIGRQSQSVQLILKFDAVMSTSKEDRVVDWDLGGHSPAKYPIFKTSKRKPKKASEESKKKARKNLTLEIPMREVPPVVDANGEFTEVQVLEEGEIFDPDQFLDHLDKHTSEPIICPRHMTPMCYDSITKSDGSTWEYYRCPTSRFWTQCYVTCGAHEVHEYLKRVSEQTHPCYEKVDPARFRCQCDKSLVLATSHSVNNPDRLYLKCPRRLCKLFQWIDEPPRGLAKAILIDGENPLKRDGNYFFMQ